MAKNQLEEHLLDYEAGGDDYIAKPFDLHELLMKVDRALASHGFQQRMDGVAKISLYHRLDDYQHGIAEIAEHAHDMELELKEKLLELGIEEHQEQAIVGLVLGREARMRHRVAQGMSMDADLADIVQQLKKTMS